MVTSHYFYRQRAFTLIELLVVILIIAILLGLLMVGVQGLRDSAKRNNTKAMIAVAMTSIEKAGFDLGGAVSGVPHPLAGTARVQPDYAVDYDTTGVITDYAGPRPLYYRESGTPLNTTERALVVMSSDDVDVGLAERTVLPDDRFAETGVPHLFGMTRKRLFVLGASSEITADYQQIRKRSSALAVVEADLVEVRVHPVISARLTTNTFGGAMVAYHKADAGDAWENEWRRSVRTGLGDGLDRLIEMKMIRVPATSASLLADNRLRVYEGIDGPGSGATWEPGRILDSGNWQAYALRGPTLIDAWGTEVLLSLDEAGRTMLTSAGADGSFRYAVGENGILDSTDPFLAPAGDDLNAEDDNIVIFGDK